MKIADVFRPRNIWKPPISRYIGDSERDFPSRNATNLIF